MTKRLQGYLATRQTIVVAMEGILEVASAAGGVLTEDQQKAYDEQAGKLTGLDASIKRERDLMEAQRMAPSVHSMHDRRSDEKFLSLGENLQAIARASAPTGSMIGAGEVDPRLYGAANFPSGASANVGPDGGFLIQKDFALDLTNKGEASGALSSRCSSTEIGDNADSLEVVTIDEYSRATGSRWGGVQVYRRSEADTVAAKQPKFGKWESRLEDMMGLAYITERALQDASALGSVFTEAFADEFGFKLDDEIFRGTGAGQCFGLIKHDSFIAVPKEVGQAAKTIVAENVMNMWARVPGRYRARGAWFYNVACEPQLQTMQIGTGASAQLVYMPPGGLRGNDQFGTIYGRPAIPIEQAEDVGTLGDLVFFDLNEYKLIKKGGVKQDDSIHVRFIYNERTFRWVTRINGQPKWKTVLTPYKGANTLSPFVGIASR